MFHKTLSFAASLLMSATALKLTQDETEPLQLAQEQRQQTTLDFHVNVLNKYPVDQKLTVVETVTRQADTSHDTQKGTSTVDIDYHIVAIDGKHKDVWYNIDMIIDHRAASGLPPASDGTVDMEIHVKSMRKGGSHQYPTDDWFTIDKMINFAPEGSSTEPVKGGHCRNVKKGSWSYTQNKIEQSGSFDVCMDACDIFGGTVVMEPYSSSWYNSKRTTPTCKLTETQCGKPWWDDNRKICDVGCSQSGGWRKLKDATDPWSGKTC